MLKDQQEMIISKYAELYDILVTKDNILRQIKELVDFSFILAEIGKNYNSTQGRGAEDPIRMFKYLMLKDMHEISDEDLVERTRCDMSFKYFLDLAPEETNLIHPTTLTKFRRLRLKNEDILDKLIGKTLIIALENGIKLGKALVVDATHTRAKYHQKSMEEVLLERAKKLRRDVYQVDETMKGQFPQKLVNPSLEEVIGYCDEVAQVVESNARLSIRENIKKRLNYLKEGLSDTQAALEETGDYEARVGHKSVDDPFFGYKTHISMTEERLITAAVITSGEKPDGAELQTLIEKSQANGIEVEEVIGDTAYSGKENLEYAEEKDIKMISKLHPIISNGVRNEEDEFTFNKDANLFVCPAGHLAVRKARTGKKNTNTNQTMTYYFDIQTCKKCSQRQGCYKEGAKSKTYSVSIKSKAHEAQMHFEETEYFKTRYRERYMIEAKNSELKNQHGYDVAISSGLFGMRVQGAISIFNVNIKRILTLIKQNKGE
ncbi:IS1182 family transposase [Anaerosolibacter sp.]|uniref:IS1182 family transposase n=1 Tax=Anaerosolibacter sp. TaxID=1872527 RepID=UPI0039F0CD7E